MFLRIIFVFWVHWVHLYFIFSYIKGRRDNKIDREGLSEPKKSKK